MVFGIAPINRASTQEVWIRCRGVAGHLRIGYQRRLGRRI